MENFKRLMVSVDKEDAEFMKKNRMKPSIILQEQIKHLRKQRSLQDLQNIELENKIARMSTLISNLSEFINQRGLQDVFQKERTKRLDNGIKYDLGENLGDKK